MKIILTFLFLSVLLLSGETNNAPRIKTSTTEGIELSATAVTENDGRTLIKCTLTNKSAHVLASCGPRTKSLCFQFALKDRDGTVIPMDKSWALNQAQPDGTNQSRINSKSLFDPMVRPKQTCEFEFYLEDAYNEHAKDGVALEVKWNNCDPLPRGYSTLKMDEMVHTDGTVTPAYEEENHFPGFRVFEVKLPLTIKAFSENMPLPNASAQSGTKPTKEQTNQTQSQVHNTPVASRSFDRRWLALLLIPIAFLFRRIVCTKKQ